MTAAWEAVAEALRSEISEYGRLLRLLEEQQKLVFARDPQGVVRSNGAIRQQVEALQDCRRRREAAAAALAEAQGMPREAKLRALAAAAGPQGGPLIEGLVDEVNRLVHRVRRAMRLNQRVLAGAVQCHQELLRRLWPASFTRTYDADGRMSAAVPARAAAVQAAG